MDCFKLYCQRPARVHPSDEHRLKQKQIMQYIGEGLFVEETFEYMRDKVEELEKRKKKSRFKFRGVGRLVSMDMGSGEKKPPPKRTFKAVGKATRMGIIAASKPKMSSIEEGGDAAILPKSKWTFKSLGKLTRLRTTKPKPKGNKWTLKAIANFIRYGPASPQNAELVNKMEAAKTKRSLKTFGKLAKMGFLRNDEIVEKPKSKFSIKGLGKLAKMGFLRNDAIVEKPKSKFSIKGLGKLGKFSLFNSKKEKTVGEKGPKRGKTLKSFGKASILGATVSKTAKIENSVKPKKKWTFKSLGKVSQLGVAVSKGSKPGGNPNRKKHKKKSFTFKFLAKFSKLGNKSNEAVCTCGDSSDELYECTCPDSDDE